MKKNLVILFIIVIGAVYIVLNYEKNQKMEEHFKNIIQNDIDMYEVMYSQFEKKSKLLYYTLLKSGDVIKIYKKLQIANHNEKNDLRRELYTLLKEDYQKYRKEFKIKQIHFHMPNNDSFLRLHKPKKHSDNLTGIRQTVEYVNKYKKPINGFEVGRVYSGFRFVYPLKDENDIHLGSIEVSFDVRIFVEEFVNQFNELSNFHIKNIPVNEKIWRDSKDKYYVKSPLENYYNEEHIIKYIENQIKSDFNKISPSKAMLAKINSKIKSTNKAFSIYLSNRNKVVVFMPVFHPITKEKIAYLSIRNDGEYTKNILSDFYTLLFLAILFASTIFYFIYKELNVQQKMQKLLKAKVEDEMEKNFQKERLLIEQSKMANLGAMIGNIAHQWRQPLNHISVIASGIKLNQEFDEVDSEQLLENMDTIISKTSYLSETINTFRNFLKEKKEVKEVVLQERIGTALDIVNISLKDNKIKLYNDIDYSHSIKIKMVVGELTEVIINIINNAKDVLIENNINKPWIRIGLFKEANEVIITIEDNGGGIPDDVMPHIFDEYFTTKDESVGTGLGLHMSYKIVTQSLSGKLYAKNTDYGAKFFIELPFERRYDIRRLEEIMIKHEDQRKIIRREEDRE